LKGFLQQASLLFKPGVERDNEKQQNETKGKNVFISVESYSEHQIFKGIFLDCAKENLLLCFC
jgi:hypothetical protein